MGGYGIYVWSSYIVVLLSLFTLFVSSVIFYRKNLKHIQNKQKK